MAKKDKKEALLEVIQENTREWEANDYERTDRRSEKAKQLSKVLTEMTLSDADKDRLAKLSSLMSGEEVIVEKENDLEFATLTALVITRVSEKHKHTYETDSLVISIGDGTAVDQHGKLGSPIPPTREILRPATKDEIEKISDEQLKGLMKEVNIVMVKK